MKKVSFMFDKIRKNKEFMKKKERSQDRINWRNGERMRE